MHQDVLDSQHDGYLYNGEEGFRFPVDQPSGTALPPRVTADLTDPTLPPAESSQSSEAVGPVVRIVPNQDFKHGRCLFKTGEVYMVTPELAAYFKDAKWVGEESR
jgi:hypothetical protein